MPSDTALILHVQRLSTEDGPGIRSTVFFKGCSLRCAWCHNPESLSPHAQLQWLAGRCIACGTCMQACVEDALHRAADGTLRINRSRCTLCGACVDACPGAALELLGRTVTVDALVQELAKDRVFYEKSGGGVSASGGEPALQAPFVARLFRRLREIGIEAALDTCGQCGRDALQQAAEYSGLVLYDLKLMDRADHVRFTGQHNERILDNLLWMRDDIRAHGHPRLWIRTPLIPRATATEVNVYAIGSFLARELAGVVERWELCAFNNLCRDKYGRLDLPWEYAATPLLSRAELDGLAAVAHASGFDPARIAVTGAARIEETAL